MSIDPERELIPARVFVTQYSPRLVFEEANKWGEVVFLTDKEYRPQPCPEGTNDIVHQEIRRNLSEYVPGYDYIVTTGSAIPNLLVGAWLALHHPGAVHNILKWDNRDYKYELFKVEITT